MSREEYDANVDETFKRMVQQHKRDMAKQMAKLSFLFAAWAIGIVLAAFVTKSIMEAVKL